MANSTLSSFDPFATHPFTNNNALSSVPSPAKPSKYPTPIPSSSMTYPTSYNPAFNNPTNAMSQSSRPAPEKPIPAPQAVRPIMNTTNSSTWTRRTPQKEQKPIFITFQQDRSSPELEEILLRRKLTQTLGPVALGLDVKQYQTQRSSS